jgi:alpha-L-rhamnosidase
MKMLGSSEVFFYRDLAGIALAAPGFQRITIKPHLVGDVTWVKASHNTIRGRVAVHWRKGGNSLAMDVTIPANTTAKVSVPSMGLEAVGITESGKPVWTDGSYVDGVAGITGGVEFADNVSFDVGSGSYRFKLTGTAPREE